jgi:hypothetical protein
MRHTHILRFLCLLLLLHLYYPLTNLPPFYGIYVLTHYINSVSIHQELMSSIQFQSSLIFLDHPDGMFERIVGKQWRWSISSFWIGKASDGFSSTRTLLSKFTLMMARISPTYVINLQSRITDNTLYVIGSPWTSSAIILSIPCYLYLLSFWIAILTTFRY